MRYLRARRRFRFILTLLLAAAAVLFLETRVESFTPQLKYLAASKIEEIFDKRINISIGDADGGIIRPLTLTKCEFRDDKGESLFPYISIDNIMINYRIWDALLKGRPLGPVSELLTKEPFIDIKFRAKNRMLLGFVRLENHPGEIRLRGYMNTFNGDRIDLKGVIKLGRFKLESKLKYGVLVAEGDLFSGDIVTNIKINHFSWNGFDIVCDGVLKSKIMPDPANGGDYAIEGEFETKSLIVNYRPFLDIRMSYRISGDRLEIRKLEAGSNFRVSGWIMLREPYDIDMAITADNANLNRLFSSLNVNENDIFLTGMLNGKVRLAGTLRKPRISANIEINNGKIKELDFEHLTASLTGEGPLMRVEDSRIVRAGGYLALGGEIDFSKMGKDSMFSNIKLMTDESAMLWDDLASMKGEGYQEVKMTKRMSDEVNLGFKKFVNDNKVDESNRDSDEVELKYKLHPTESLKLMVGENKDFFGLEHKDKF